MYLTLHEAAIKYKLNGFETDKFLRLMRDDFSHLVFSNPDISASNTEDAHIVEAKGLPLIMRKVLARGDEKSDAVIAGLRTNAITAVASWLVEANKAGYVDYTVDMRADGVDDDMDRQRFCTDNDTVSDMTADLDDEVAKLVRLLQK